MTNESHNGKSQQSGSARKEKMASIVLLAAVLILSSSLGVTAIEYKPKTTVNPSVQSNQAKPNPPASQPTPAVKQKPKRQDLF